MEIGRAVHELDKKLLIMTAVLWRKGLLAKTTRKSLAAAAGIGEAKLQYATGSNRISIEVEQKLADFAGFDARSLAWVDESVSKETRRKVDVENYKGADTATEFGDYFTRLHFPADMSSGSRPRSYDRGFISHKIELRRTAKGDELDLGLQASFGELFDPNGSGIRYCIRQARLDVEISGGSGRFLQRLGAPKAHRSRDADFKAFGTDPEVAWRISAEEAEAGTLDGIYDIRNPPLATIADCRENSQVQSRMRVNLHNVRAVAEKNSQPISPARLQVIQAAFERAVLKPVEPSGWVTVSEHDLSVREAS